VSIDRLQAKIRTLKNPSVLDLSFDPELFPAAVRKAAPSDVESYHFYARELLKELVKIIPAVRFRMSSFMLLGAYGIELLRDTAQYARYLGYYVLMDVPHTTSRREAEISAQYLMQKDSLYPADGLILNPYIGSDGIKPYLNRLQEMNMSLFVILRTANRTAFELQDLQTGSRMVHWAAAETASHLGKPLIHKCGYSQVAGIAAANAQESLAKLRKSHQNLFLLVDGYDAQGACAKRCSAAFDVYGYGAAVCAGESIVGAWRDHPDEQEDYLEHAVEAAKRMRSNLTRYVKIL